MKRRNNAGPGLLTDLVDMIHFWWRKDQVRTSPREGRLLRVEAGSILDAQGQQLEVLKRETIETHHGTVVRYDCEGTDSRCELWISMTTVPLILLISGDDERELIADDIEVWGPGRDCNRT